MGPFETRKVTIAVILSVLLMTAAWPVPVLATHYSRPTDGHTFAYQQGYSAGESNCSKPGRPAPNLTNNSDDFKQGYGDGCTTAQKKWQYDQGYKDGYRACQNQGVLQAPPSGPLDYIRGFMQGCREALGRRPADNQNGARRGQRTATGVRITEVTPGRGPAAGGETVQIQGQGFADASAVSFGIVKASDFRVDSDSQVTATVPPGTPGTKVYVTVARTAKVSAVAQATGNGYVLQSDGTVWAWGNNTYGQLGNATFGESTDLVQVYNLTSVKAIAADFEEAFALKADGTVVAWGRNSSFNLGDDYGPRNTPRAVAGLSGVTALAAASDTTYALKANGSVWAVGSASKGRLGNGVTDRDSPVPVPVAGLSDIIAIAAHFGGGYALRNDGTVWAWGDDSARQLGQGCPCEQYRISSTPVQVKGLTGVTAIAGGADTGYALKSDGTVWSWGLNSSGELGIGRPWDRQRQTGQLYAPEPVQVEGLTNVKAIAAGQRKAYALKRDGTVWEWGWMGGENYTYSPNQVQGVKDVAAINGGAFAAYGFRSDGSVWAWGVGNHPLLGGNLGRTPVLVELLDPELVSSDTGPTSEYSYEGGMEPPQEKLNPPPEEKPKPPPGEMRNGIDCGSEFVPAYMKRQAGCTGYGEQVKPPPDSAPGSVVPPVQEIVSNPPEQKPVEPTPDIPPPAKPLPANETRDGIDCGSPYVPTYMKRGAGCPGYGQENAAPPPTSAPPVQTPVQMLPPPETKRDPTILFGIDCDSPEIPNLWKKSVGCP